MLLEGKILVQFKQDAAAEIDVLDAVECSHWLTLELLLDAIGIGEIENVHVRPDGAFMEEDGRHLGGSGLVGGCSHLLAEELQGGSAGITSKKALIDR